MKYYKECEKIYIGDSDMAALTIIKPDKPEFLKFGEDGVYRAYIIDENTELGEHYQEVMRAKHWVKIIDDDRITIEIDADEIIFYRAGSFGCAIRLTGENKKVHRFCY